MSWLKILQYIFRGFIIYLCGALLYFWLAFNGGVGEKVFMLVIIVILIDMITSDFQDDIIKWFKKTLKD